MRKLIVVGLGIQGKKRLAIAKDACVATVDPYQSADYKTVQEVPLHLYEAALVCTPDASKIEILRYLLSHGKHVLVEKPLFADSEAALLELQTLAIQRQVACYTAYNHRFEPHFKRVKQLIDSGQLGHLYYARLFYGNGTARDVLHSPWRDKKGGVLPDLGSHLLDTILYWFGADAYDFCLTRCDRFENRSPDHVSFRSQRGLALDLEMSLLSYRNHFTCDLVGEKGSAHIESLCKWGPSTFIWRKRKLPSGRPEEEAVTLVQSDPTWEEEYHHFIERCRTKESNLANDLWINQVLQTLSETAGVNT